MIEISANSIRLRKKERDIIERINGIILENFKNIPLEKKQIRVFFKEDEEYYSYLGYEKPYRNLIVTDGVYDGEYQEIFIRINARSLIQTYIHEIGHFLDYNLITQNEAFQKIGSAFTRKVYEDMPFEDKLLKDIQIMPAYTLIHVAGGKNYVLAADEIFARLFEVFIWEKLDRKYFTPDLYIKTSKLFLYLNNWLVSHKDSVIYSKLAKLHYYLLNRSINKRKMHDPFKEDRFTKYVEEFLV